MSPRADHLRALLHAHRCADDAETGHKSRMLALLDEPAPFSRHTFEPGHFTASSFVLSPDSQSILLIFHSKLERWLQPGGHVDPTDEDIVAAARRELAEEVGLTDLAPEAGLLDLDIHLIPALTRTSGTEPAHEHFDVRLLFRAKDDRHTAGSDALDAMWVPLAEVNAVDSDSSVLRAVRKLGR